MPKVGDDAAVDDVVLRMLVYPESTVMYYSTTNCVVCSLSYYILLLTIIVFYNYPIMSSQVPKVGDDAAVDVVGEVDNDVFASCLP